MVCNRNHVLSVSHSPGNTDIYTHTYPCKHIYIHHIHRYTHTHTDIPAHEHTHTRPYMHTHMVTFTVTAILYSGILFSSSTLRQRLQDFESNKTGSFGVSSYGKSLHGSFVGQRLVGNGTVRSSHTQWCVRDKGKKVLGKHVYYTSLQARFCGTTGPLERGRLER